jgi:hypothetical protein
MTAFGTKRRLLEARCPLHFRSGLKCCNANDPTRTSHGGIASSTADRLAELTAHVGRLQGELRAVHLKYHLTTAELLSAEQSKRYAELRGYR